MLALSMKKLFVVFFNLYFFRCATYRRSHLEVFCKKVFLKIPQNSQENTCARVSFLMKLQASGLQLYEKRDSGTGVLL